MPGHITQCFPDDGEQRSLKLRCERQFVDLTVESQRRRKAQRRLAAFHDVDDRRPQSPEPRPRRDRLLQVEDRLAQVPDDGVGLVDERHEVGVAPTRGRGQAQPQPEHALDHVVVQVGSDARLLLAQFAVDQLFGISRRFSRIRSTASDTAAISRGPALWISWS